MKERWYSLSVEETEKKLNTNTASGLTPKEAALRRKKSRSGSLYKQIGAPVSIHVAKVASDITVILFAVIAFVSMFFGGGKSAALSIVLVGMALAVATLSYVLSKRIFESAEELSRPRIRVVRSGRVYVIDADDVVEGDVLLLKKGDVVPCDCRLVTSDSLKALEFVGKSSDKEKRELLVKNASAIYGADMKLGIAAQENMISASAVVLEGSARAIAVKVGKNTFISIILGELDVFSSRRKDMRVLSSSSSIISKQSLAILILTLPITAIAMISVGIRGASDVGIIDVMLVMLATAVTSGSELLAAMFAVFPALAMRRAAKTEKGARLKVPAAIEEMNYLDSVLFLGRKSFCTNEKRIESVFASNRFYSLKSEKDQAFNCFIDLAVLGTSHFMNFGDGGNSCVRSATRPFAKTVSDYAESVGINREKLLENYSIVEFSGSDMSGYDTTLVKNGEEYRVICVSDNPSLLNLCSHIRTPEGATEFAEDKKSDIARACMQLAKKSSKVTLVASRISPCSSLSRLGAVQNQLIFEGYIVYSDPFVDNISKRISSMREADISLFYADEETVDSVIAVFNTGLVKSKHEIANASAFRKQGKSITADFGQYNAYLGFSESELEILARHIRGRDGTLAVIGSEVEHLPIMNVANISVALSYDDEKNAIESISDLPEILRKDADIILPEPGKDKGGFEAFYDVVMSSKNACAGFAGFFKYMLFAATLRITLACVPLLLGYLILSPTQIVLLGVLIDFPALFEFAFKRTENPLGNKIADVETVFSKPYGSCSKYLILGGALGGVMILLSAVFGFFDIASGTLLTFFSFAGAALTQLAAVMIISRLEEDERGRKIFAVHVAAFVLLLILSLAMPGLGALVGVAYPGWQVCVAVPLSVIIGYVMIQVTDRYI